MVIKVFLILMVVFAILSVQTPKLHRAVIYLGIFSLISSFCYILYKAPDVAIAEAIIASTLVTILYLVALQKYRVFTIYYVSENLNNDDKEHIKKGSTYFLSIVEMFCVSKELEPQVVYTTEELDNIITDTKYDLIIKQNGSRVFAYGNHQNYHLGALEQYVHDKGVKEVQFIKFCDKGGV